ncbi:MAG: nucleotidyltransferase [Alphaproteobacteria bacterium]|nr:nucleotidyltransferase [Alphaproteobacteria bacterium]MBU1516561.1 nucleotidyltransferase [Alphaproteobacteria bacterium]MBU2094318.1 nucleotidyltransferase [Alphaproteobacteria bacterium]MBU2154105.1 nucleotidyltransferase [Alphaproteobacteria bacterium]MBU2307488.1 nucleotidyltransferase [Alphaproteobacteria bacterium]
MATGTTQQAEAYLQAMVDELSISDTRYEQAERSYTSLGEWLGRPESTLSRYDPAVYVQGSFRLGTVIRPPSEAEDYDVDAVCELRRLRTSQLSQQKLKQMLEVEIRSYHKAQSMVKPVREGRRCWVLHYADGAQFHMDVVPCVPDADRQRRLLEVRQQKSNWSATAVAITDNERWNYTIIDEDWCRSNPKAYAEWFKQRMSVVFNRRKQMMAEVAKASVESIPDYRVRTPLQAAIMVLKRHRDVRFAGKPEDRPISIILSTLAAHAYGGEDTIGAALLSILEKMDQFIFNVDGKLVISNPTDPLENFADKWETHPHRAKAFFDWLAQARQDFAYIAAQADPQRITETAASSIGRDLAQRALQKSSGGGRLRAATVAPTSGLAFPAKARVPSEPQGFA